MEPRTVRLLPYFARVNINGCSTRSAGLEPHTFEHPAQVWTCDVPVASPPTSRRSTGMSRNSGRMLIHRASCSPAAHSRVLVFCHDCGVRDFTLEQDSAAGEEQRISEEGTEEGGRERAYGGDRGWGRCGVNTGKERAVDERAVERRNIRDWTLRFMRKARFYICSVSSSSVLSAVS